jgi:hypothetical protein
MSFSLSAGAWFIFGLRVIEKAALPRALGRKGAGERRALGAAQFFFCEAQILKSCWSC